MGRFAASALVCLVACSPPPGLRTEGPRLPTWTPVPGETPGAASILPEDASPITFERMAKFPEPGWQAPRRLEASPDGALVTYLMSERGDDEMALWAVSLATGERKVLVRSDDLADAPKKDPSLAEELRAERQRRRTKGISEYAWAHNAPVLVIPNGGDVFVRDTKGALTQLTATEAPEIDPKPCADGSKVAFVRDSELFVVDVATKKETQLTQGAPEGVTRGQSDFNAQEEFEEPSGFFWSPDCKKVVYLEVDERKVAEVPVLGYRGGEPSLMMQRYPRAGASNPATALHVVDVTSKKDTTVILPKEIADQAPYLGRFEMAEGWLAFWAVARSQREASLLRVRLADKPQASVLFTVKATPSRPNAWVEMPAFACGARASDCYFTAEREGHDHLDRIDLATNARVEITRGDWDVTSIAGVDQEGRAYFLSTMAEPLGRTLFRTGEKGTLDRLTAERGVHDVVVSPTRGLVADVHSALDRPPSAVVFGDGDKRVEIPIPRDADWDQLRLRTPELVSIDAQGGVPKLFGAVLPPRQLTPGQRYPLVVMVYGGPGAQTVLDRWSPRLPWQHLADRGFFVMQFDNRGSAGRGPAFAGPIANDLGTVELADQLRALDFVTTRYPIDDKRVGIYGHSYGGTMAALAMLKAPGRYKSAIAASPVTDWRLYDSGYTERYMRSPSDNPGGYAATDLESLAPNLAGELLVIHALMDENVHFQHSAELVDALVRANKPFEMFVFPGERHGYRSPPARRYAMSLTTRFLVRTLGNPTPSG
ncbi:MAG: alpha/beta fold hydrolase [Myxococcales bacterium]|nr:alpha/beta fold hydrolase [Myxococcales bacterium]